MVHKLGEGSAIPTDPQHTPTIIQPSSSQPQKTQKPRKPTRKDTRVSQPSGPTGSVADEAVHKELGDRLVRAATTASSLEAKEDSGGGPKCQESMGDTTAQTRFESVSKHSNDSLLARRNTLQSDEDRHKLDELIDLCTNLKNRFLDLEQTKTTQKKEIASRHDESASLKRRVKKLEKRNRPRTHKLKRLYKVGLSARVESFGDEYILGEDASKQERRIDVIDADKDITLVFVARQNINVVEEVVDAAQVSTATTTVTITTEEITLAQALEALKTSKPKDKGKGIMIKEPVKPKKKDQIRIDEEPALKLQAKFDEKERLAREKAKKEQEANIALIEEWDDIQAKIYVDHQKEKEQTTNKSLTDKDNVYLPKNIEGYKLKDLKLKEFDRIQKMFDRTFRRVNTFKYIRTELVEGYKKRAGEELIQESIKKQKVEDDKEKAELKQLMETSLDEEEVAIDDIPLAIKSSRIVD
nr:hypothetical protein [Tanacetum cinerariifolium]